MKQYLDALKYVLEYGNSRQDRTGTGTLSVFAPAPLRFDMRDGFPLVTTKKMFTKGIIEELLWFLRGDTSVNTLREKGVHIWDGNYESYKERMKELYDIDVNGDLGPIYGKQWRCWEARVRTCLGEIAHVEVDQMRILIDSLRYNPNSRRHVVNAWNVADIEAMALPPCHCFFQCYVRKEEDGETYLDMSMYQRSADMFLGVPFNIASYALLLHILCEQTGYTPGVLTIMLGDAHIYKNHIEQVREQITRDPFVLPTLSIAHRKYFDDHVASDFVFNNYQCHPAIKADMSV